jgi:hypothetical protein
MAKPVDPDARQAELVAELTEDRRYPTQHFDFHERQLTLR